MENYCVLLFQLPIFLLGMLFFVILFDVIAVSSVCCQVLFADPVVVTSCEIVEQNAPSACPSLKLVGYSSYSYLPIRLCVTARVGGCHYFLELIFH